MSRSSDMLGDTASNAGASEFQRVARDAIPCNDAELSRTMASWVAMLTRCLNPLGLGFFNYGARGISVDERWMDFRSFLADLGPRPTGTTLGRINVNGHYCLSNCRWETSHQQSGARRSIRGDGLCDSADSRWCDVAGLTADERARRATSIVLTRLAPEGTQRNVAQVWGVSESSVSRLKEHVEPVMRLVAQLGLKVVPAEMKCYSPRESPGMGKHPRQLPPPVGHEVRAVRALYHRRRPLRARLHRRLSPGPRWPVLHRQPLDVAG